MSAITSIESEQEALPQGWRWVRLEDVCREEKATVRSDDEKVSRLPYISLEHVAPQTGRIDPVHIKAVTNTVRSNTYAFDDRHVLYGKLRPYLNKVTLPNFEGRCTTEIIPLLPEGVTRDYLAYVLRRPHTVEFAMKIKTGSRMPRTDMKVFMGLSIPLPPLPEQKRIVRILDEKLAKIEKVKRVAEAQLEVISALPGSYLRRAFAGELR